MIYTFKEIKTTHELTNQTDVDGSFYPDEFHQYVSTQAANDIKFEAKPKTNTTIAGNRTTTTTKTARLKIEDLHKDTTHTVRKHRVMVMIDLHSYYASVDESGATLSDATRRLLETRDYPGFFHSCGTYYIRSIGRKAKFVSIFSRDWTTSEENSEFTFLLENQIKKFVTTTVRKVDPKTGQESTRIARQSETSETNTILSGEAKFQEISSRDNLTITTYAFGLGKNSSATLISYDFDTFKKAIADAFISMQNPQTGKVISMEVVPWVENSDFQVMLQLDQFREEAGKGDTKQISKQEPVPLYMKKHFVNENGEFLAEIAKADRNKMNIYFKSKLCRQQIDTNYKSSGQFRQYPCGADGQKLSYASFYVRNNKNPGDSNKVTLGELDQIISPAQIDSLYQSWNIFTGEARTCMATLVKNLVNQSYRTMPACMQLVPKLAQIEDDIIANHCLPSPILCVTKTGKTNNP